jgi:transposase-like protein
LWAKLSLIYQAVKMRNDFKNLIELLDYFKEEKTCQEFLAHQIWDEGKAVCPHCNSTKVYITKNRSSKPEKQDIPSYRCADKTCGKKFTTTTGTIFESTHVNLRTWFAAIYLITAHKKGISSHQLGRDLSVTQKTAWFVLHRVREMFKETAPNMLKDVVQLDDSYFGGKNKNRHSDKKIENSQGRSLKDKTPIIAVRGLAGNIKSEVIPNTQAATIKPIIDKWVEKGSIMVSDEWTAYNCLKKDYFHIVVNHNDGEYVRGAFTSNGVENFWSLFKRGIYGIYHQVSPKHLHRYSEEFQYRYNSRKIKDNERFTDTLQNSSNFRLTYKQLTNK